MIALDNITLPPAPRRSKDLTEYQNSIEQWARNVEQTIRQFERVVRLMLTQLNALP